MEKFKVSYSISIMFFLTHTLKLYKGNINRVVEHLSTYVPCFSVFS